MHAMNYEQALLAPFALVMAFERRLHSLPFVAYLASPVWPPAVALVGVYACVLTELRARRSASVPAPVSP